MTRLNASLGTVSSVAIHAAAGVVLVVGWPYLNPPAPEPLPPVPVELLSEADIAEYLEVPETAKVEEPADEPEPAPEEPEPEPEPEPVAPKPEPAQPEPEPEPAPPEPEPEAPEPEPEPEPTPPEPEPDDELDFDTLEGLIDLTPDDERDAPKEVADDAEGGEVDAEQVGLGERLLASEEAAIRGRVEGRCWNRQSGVPNIETLIVTVNFKLDRQGALIGAPKVENAGEIRRSGNAFWRVAQDRAVAAVQDCAPYDYLSQDRYDVWRDITMTFYPPAE